MLVNPVKYPYSIPFKEPVKRNPYVTIAAMVLTPMAVTAVANVGSLIMANTFLGLLIIVYYTPKAYSYY